MLEERLYFTKIQYCEASKINSTVGPLLWHTWPFNDYYQLSSELYKASGWYNINKILMLKCLYIFQPSLTGHWWSQVLVNINEQILLKEHRSVGWQTLSWEGNSQQCSVSEELQDKQFLIKFEVSALVESGGGGGGRIFFQITLGFSQLVVVTQFPLKSFHPRNWTEH